MHHDRPDDFTGIQNAIAIEVDPARIGKIGPRVGPPT